MSPQADRDVHVYTSATFSYIDRARVLAESVRRHHPDWTFWFVLSDEPPEGLAFDPAAEPFDRVVRLPELGVPDWRPWAFEHDIVELCTGVKGHALELIFGAGAGKVLYIDPDIEVFETLRPVADLLERHPVVLTPHLLAAEGEDVGTIENERTCLTHGTYNLGFLAVADGPTGRAFARWWRDRLHAHCFYDIPNGLFGDQLWCNLVPALFENVHVLRDPGYNVASWNLNRRPILIEPGTGAITAAGHPLRFYHFTKVDHVGETMIRRHGGDALEPMELLLSYRRRLEARRMEGMPPGWWHYGRYADGAPIPKPDRIAYRGRPDLHRRFPDPFTVGRGSYREWLRG